MRSMYSAENCLIKMVPESDEEVTRPQQSYTCRGLWFSSTECDKVNLKEKKRLKASVRKKN